MKFDLLKILFVSLLIFGVVACGGEKDEPEETIDETIDEVEKTVEEVADTTAEVAEEVLEYAKEAADKAEDKVEKAVKRNDYTSSPMPCFVVSLNEVAAGREGRVSKSDAQALINNGQILGVKNTATGEVYMVYHSNGMFAGSDLVNMAEIEKIGILGTAKLVKGVNIIMADKMRPMR